MFAALQAALSAANLPDFDLEADNAEYFALSHSEEVLGFVGIAPLGKEGLLRSLVVPQQQRGCGNGACTVEAAANHARRAGIERLWLLTTNAERYFIRRGFRIITRNAAPAAIAASRQFSSTCPDTAVLMCLTLA